VRHKQGLVAGRLEAAGFSLRARTALDSLTREISDSFGIEGERIDETGVRSSIARRLGIESAGTGASAPAGHFVEGVVDMMLDATRNSEAPLTEERLFGWHSALFPGGRSGVSKIAVGGYRAGRMRIVSGPIGREKVHYEAPPPGDVPQEMASFLSWLDADQGTDAVLKAGAAHFRFVVIHPFDDGNGRLARAIAELMLTRADGGLERYYSLSSRMLAERSDYYATLERCQYADGDITEWLLWYLGCLGRALDDSAAAVEGALRAADFWDKHRDAGFNARQQRMVNMLLDGLEGRLTTKKWAKITKSSHDTALRDIKDLIEKGVLRQEEGGGRSTSYRLAN
jgi:Fic family protein